jgi:hypothetical protein
VNAQAVTSWGTLTLRSANTSADAISITGNALSSTGGSSLGINAVALFEATGAGGGITITGKSGVASTNASVNLGGDILAASGPITISGENISGVVDNIMIGSTTTIGKKSGTNVTSSSSNVILEGNRINTTGAVLVDCSGRLTVRPFGNSFASALTWPMPNVSLASSITGLTIGKPTNTANVTFTNATTINGPITIYGGTLALNENLTSSAGSTISLYGNALNIAIGKTVTSSGQLILATQDTSATIGLAGASGTLQLPASYFSTNFTDGFSSITIGRNNQIGAISSNAFTLRDHIVLLTNNSLTLGGSVTMGNNNVTLGLDITTISGMPTYYFTTNGTGKVNRMLTNNSSRIFPVGNAKYNPVAITNKTGTADDFSVNVVDTVYQNGNSGLTITDPHVELTWNIDKQNPNSGSGVDFSFSWDTTQEYGVVIPYELNHHDGSVWELALGTIDTVIVNGSARSLTHSGYTGSISPFSILQRESLPVDFLGMQAECIDGSGVLLSWQTANEFNSSHYEIYRSENAVDWSYVGAVNANGNSLELSNYTFMDEEVSNNINYYQLKQVDTDGSFKQMPIISKQCSEMSQGNIYPNPTSSGAILKIDLEFDMMAEILVLDAVGKTVIRREQMLRSGINQIYIDLTNELSGIYLVKIRNTNQNIQHFKFDTIKLMKK